MTESGMANPEPSPQIDQPIDGFMYSSPQVLEWV